MIMQESIDNLMKRYDNIEESIAKLQKQITSPPTNLATTTAKQVEFRNEHLSNPWEHDTDDVKRVKRACTELKLSSARLHKVPSDYYQHSLEERRQILAAPSVDCLCKSMLIENTHCVNDDCSDPKNSKFYCIVMQYTTKLSTDKIMRYLRELNDNKLGKRKFYFRLAHADEQSKLTGYKFNAVAPVGMTENVPIIVSERILQTVQNIYLGGGEVDVKLEVNAKEFVEATGAFVADVTISTLTLLQSMSEVADE